jgi:uncharacterized protein YbjT (DUF2867 family)
MRTLIAGATGAIGRRLVPLLVTGGYEVFAMTRSPDKADSLRASDAEPVVADGFDRATVRQALMQPSRGSSFTR